MEEVLNYLKACQVFYLATNEGDQPRVRPFGAEAGFDGKLYLVTTLGKKVYAQMLKNPKVEICGMHPDKTWIRIQAEAILDERAEARTAMMEQNKAALSEIYTPNDPTMKVLYLKNALATIYSFTAKPKIIRF